MAGGRRQAAVVEPRKSGQRAVEPTVFRMEFPSGGSLPSIGELKAKLGRYGVLDHDGTRVYWKTFTCLVVYKYKADALAALEAVQGGCNPFGNTDVKYSLKEVSASKPPPNVLDHHPAVEDRVAAAKLALKSCLKKSSGEEGGDSGGRMTSRVKFNLTRGESHNSKNFKKGVLPLSTSTRVSTAPPPPPPPLASPPPPRSSMLYSTQLAPPSLPPRPMHGAQSLPVAPLQRPPRLTRPAAMLLPPKIDIAQQMVSLLTRCNDVVAHVTGILGYVPYHPL